MTTGSTRATDDRGRLADRARGPGGDLGSGGAAIRRAIGSGTTTTTTTTESRESCFRRRVDGSLLLRLARLTRLRRRSTDGLRRGWSRGVRRGSWGGRRRNRSNGSATERWEWVGSTFERLALEKASREKRREKKMKCWSAKSGHLK